MLSVSVPRPECLKKLLAIPHRHMFGAGPSNIHPRISEAGASPVVGPMQPQTLEVMNDIKSGIQYLFQTQNSMTLAVSSTGHGAMECAFVNAVEAGDGVLVAVNGIWGERAAELAERLGATVNTIVAPPGGFFTEAEIEQALSKHRPLVLFLAHGESSTGVLHPLAGVGALCHKYNCLFLVDSVASMGGAPLCMDQQEIDILYTGSQKVLNAPAGTAPISFSQRACQKIFNRKTKPVSFFFDLSWLGGYWGCDGKPSRLYHHTGPANAFYSLRESLAILAEEETSSVLTRLVESQRLIDGPGFCVASGLPLATQQIETKMGLEKSWERHEKVAEYFHTGLENMGLKLFVKEKKARLPTVTTIVAPHGYDCKEIITYVRKTHDLEISEGLGPTAGLGLRVGLMGCNSTKDNVDMVLAALRDALKHCHKSKV